MWGNKYLTLAPGKRIAGVKRCTLQWPATSDVSINVMSFFCLTNNWNPLSFLPRTDSSGSDSLTSTLSTAASSSSSEAAAGAAAPPGPAARARTAAGKGTAADFPPHDVFDPDQRLALCYIFMVGNWELPVKRKFYVEKQRRRGKTKRGTLGKFSSCRVRFGGLKLPVPFSILI